MNDKTMVDVADKAVDKIAGGVEAVARAIQKVAPHVWEVLVRQAKNEGWLYAGIGSGLVLIALVGGALLLTYGFRNNDDDAVATGLFGGVICLVVGLLFVAPGYLRIANPEYYAAKELIEAAK